MSLSSFAQYAMYDFWEDYADEYSTGYGLVDGPPWWICRIVIIYLLFVLIIGPRFMQNRPAYDLKNVLYYYNLLHVLGNGLCCIPALLITRGTYDCWTSLKTGDPANPYHRILLYLGFVYFLGKFLDLFDTIFFILRKKDRQVTFLHVFHHSVMPICTYIALHFAPIGRTCIVGILNSVIHTAMYSYYFMSSIPSMQQHLWWKKYLTQMQIIQFVIFFAHSLQGILLIDRNEFPLWISITQLMHSAFFLKSFTDFFKQTYRKVDIIEKKLDASRTTG